MIRFSPGFLQHPRQNALPRSLSELKPELWQVSPLVFTITLPVFEPLHPRFSKVGL